MKEKLKQINDYEWELDKNVREKMNVKCRIIASKKIVEDVEDAAVEQLTNVACLPGVMEPVVGLPDMHWGYGLPMGACSAFDSEKGIISSGLCGFDINCGINSIRTNLTFDEVRKKINELIQADKELALRISLTNQKAKAEMLDLDGKEVELTIPELIVLKNDIAPKLEEAARAIPKLANGVNFLEVTDNYKKWRSVQPYYKQKQSLSEKGHKIEEDYIDYYDVNEVTDYGIEERNVFDEIDRIHEWQHRLKEAINKANRYELVDL